MITSTPIWPRTWSSLWNPVIYEVVSDRFSETGFKYVFDVYIDGVKKTQVKQPPNPAGKGIIDVSKIVKNYIPIREFTPDFFLTGGSRLKTGELQAKRFYVLVGEEYLLGSQYVIFNGINNTTPAAPAFNPATSTSSGIFPQGVLSALTPWDYKESLSTFGSSFPLDRYSEQNRVALSRWTSTDEKIVKTYDSDVISFLSNRPQNPVDQQRYIYGFRTVFYSATGPIQTSDIFNLVANGGGPWTISTNNFTPSPTPDSKFSLINVSVGPANHYVGTIPAATTYYEVQGYLPFVGGTGSVNGTFGLPATVKYTYRLDECDSDPSGFDRIRLIWLNDLGGWDSYNFTKANSDEMTRESESYYDLSQDFSNVWSYNPYLGGDLIHNQSLTVTRTCSTDWVTERESEFLKGLFKSPRVFAYISTSPTEQGRSVTVQNTTFNQMTYAREKLFAYTFEIRESQNYSSQLL
jgi:hypothetical protein